MNLIRKIKKSMSLKSVFLTAILLLVFVSIHSFLFIWLTLKETNNLDLIYKIIPQLVAFDSILFVFYIGVVFFVLEMLFSGLHKLVEAVDSVEKGDLTVRAEVQSDDDIGRIAKAINKTLDNLSSIVKRTQSVSSQMASAAAQISQTVETQASGASEQAASISQTTATMEELTQTTREIAKNSRSVFEATEDALQFAEKGKSSVLLTVESMNEIKEETKHSAERISNLGEKTREIGNVVNIINEIADQTKILSLNAAIEAARAGEAGKGFSVVANEIRKLAENVTESTDEISKIMEDIQSATSSLVVATEDGLKNVVKGTNLANEAGNEIKNIVSKIEHIADSSKQISVATQQEISATDQVAQAMREISVVSQQSASSSKEISSSIGLLDELARELQSEISRIKVSDWWQKKEGNKEDLSNIENRCQDERRSSVLESAR